MAGRPKAEITTVQVSFRLREDEAALLRAACERLAVPPGRLLGRIIRAVFEPAAGEPAQQAIEDLVKGTGEAKVPKVEPRARKAKPSGRVPRNPKVKA